MAFKITRKTVSALVLSLGMLSLSAPVLAQAGRDPAYSAARAAGQVGEQTDGYLGFPVPPGPQTRAMVDDLNIKRKNVYAQKAQAKGSTIQAYAFVTACKLIADTVPGEKYQAPGGGWQTRTAEPPQRDSHCP